MNFYICTIFSLLACKYILADTTSEEIANPIPFTETNDQKDIENCFLVKNNFCLFGDLLFFKSVEDSLNYAERLPQNSTFTPKVKSIGQKFDYEPGFRVGLSYRSDPWEFKTLWMHYAISPSARKASASDFGLLATLATPVWGALGNSLVSKIKGSWKLNMNAVDALLERTFC